jgi:predicted transcriptional regulator
MPQPVTLEFDDSVLAALDKAAQRGKRTRSDIIHQAVQSYLGLQDWQIAKIESGVAAADLKDFASDEEIARIVEKYSCP